MRKDAKFASVDNLCRKKCNNVHIGMKLEAVDPLNTDCIRVATVKGFADHWMFLSFDRTSCGQELLHLRSVYSDEVFPVGWCNKYKYSLGVPKLPYNDSNDFEHCYYSSDVDIDLSQSDLSTKYPRYLKGEIFYHFSNKDKLTFDDGFEEIEDDYIKSEDSDSVNNVLIHSEIEIKEDTTDEYDSNPILDAKDKFELDEKFHDALFLDENDIKPEEIDIKPEEVDIKPEEVDIKLEEVDTKQEEVNYKPEKRNNAKEVNLKKKKDHVKKSIKNVVINSSKLFSKNSYKMCIYFNIDCYPGSHIAKRKIPSLPVCIGPGPVSSILQEAISAFVDLDYFPSNALENIKKIQSMLFSGPGGVEKWITTKATKNCDSIAESLLLPESRKMAKIYCSALCNLSGMCEFFMTTEETKCPHGCNKTEIKNIVQPLKPKMDTLPIRMKSKIKYHRLHGAQKSAEIILRKPTHTEISRIGEKVLDWSNKPLVSRYKHYLGSILNLEVHLFQFNKSPTELETSLITEIISKKNILRRMDKMEIFSNTKSEKLYETIEEKLFVVLDNWKSTFENYYRQNPRFKKFKIDIGQLEHIKVTSNPKYWSPEDVYKYLTNDLFCKDAALKLFAGEFDGLAFMLLNEEQLLKWLRCTINLAIRILCHVAEVKYVDD
ncbi:scm-like with four MBT domains protein 1 [Acyrthosiphon pisum]|uniref:SLED domain-containing protein n=1 Tax=Acyrthosiphon pisum TaxID=7029 RepID=A0A8R2JLE8_ACYPI|nr:scm-like with four MBT domains protein 1 [Acyrthosiphon pisum]